MRALKCFDQNLPENTIKLFQTRFEEQYDADDYSDYGKLYKIYKFIKLLLNEVLSHESSNLVPANNALPGLTSNVCSTCPTEPGDTLNVNGVNDQASSSSVEMVQNLSSPVHTVRIQVSHQQACKIPSLTDEAAEINFDEANKVILEEPAECSSHNDTNETGQQMSTLFDNSAANRSSELNDVSNAEFYGNWKFSPFKKYLSIGDNIIKRKETRMKPLHPPVVSGTDYFRNMLEKQKTREEEHQRKAER